MKEIVFLVEEAPEGGFLARALGHSIYTEADTMTELKSAVQDAVVCHLDKNERPNIVRLHLVHEEVVAVRGYARMVAVRNVPACWSSTVQLLQVGHTGS